MYLCGDNLKVLPSIKDVSIDLIVTDPPYALVSGCMTRPRPDMANYDEGKGNAYCRSQARGGFMNKVWDSKLPEAQTWLECFRVLKPGGFILVMASPRNDDLVSVSLREAGFVKHNHIPYIGSVPAKQWWINGAGFPKGTDVSKAIDAKAVRGWLSQHDHGLTPKEVNKVVSAAVNGECLPPSHRETEGDIDSPRRGMANAKDRRTAGALLISQLEEEFGSMPKRVKVGEKKRHGGGIGKSEKIQQLDPDIKDQTITAPTTPLAKEFEGMKYGQQHLKPSAEVVLVFQKPFDGSPLESILKWGVGCVDVDAGRIGLKGIPKTTGGCGGDRKKLGYGYEPPCSVGIKEDNSQGRYPSNFLISHSPGCRVVGERRVKGTGIDKGKGNIEGYTCYSDFGPRSQVSHADADGKETVREYECVEGCPVAELDRQSGESGGGKRKPEWSKDTPQGLYTPPRAIYTEYNTHGDTGTASRFFKQPEWGPADFIYQAKASSAERNAGCEGLEEKTRRTLGKGLTGISGDRSGQGGEAKEIKAGEARVANYHPT